MAESKLHWGILACVLIVVILCLGAPPIEQSRGGARHSQCRSNLKQIQMALNNYHHAYGSFPPAFVRGPDGQPWHSWRVLLLPFIERSDLYEQYRFDEPWNGPNNRELGAKRPLDDHAFYFCPADDARHDGASTSYVAVVGEGTLWPVDGSSLSLDDVPDGPDRTIHVVEVTDSGIHWMEPRDLAFGAMSFAVNAKDGNGIRSQHTGEHRWFGRTGPRRVVVGLADTNTPSLTPETPPETVRSLLLRDDGGPTDSSTWSSP